MNRYVYIGTYNYNPPGAPAGTAAPEGIFVYRMDPQSGEMRWVQSVASGPNPSFLAVHPNRRWLYSVNEGLRGFVSAFAIDPSTGKLDHLNSRPARGTDPCYLSLDPPGKWLLAANYTSGSLAVLPILEDGRLEALTCHVQHHGSGPDSSRQEGAHAHCILFAPGERFTLSADLGIDQVLVYLLSGETGKLTAHVPAGLKLKPGSGPRHIAFHPNGKFAYISNELDSTVVVCAWDGDQGSLQWVESLSTLSPIQHVHNQVADIHLTPDGAWLYVSNRGQDNLAVFSVDSLNGKLQPAGHVSTGGEWPRNFAIDPEGRYLLVANQYSAGVVVFEIRDGIPTPTGQTVPVANPACVHIVDLS